MDELDPYDCLSFLRTDLEILETVEQQGGRWPQQSFYQAHMREAQRHVKRAIASLEESLPFWDGELPRPADDEIPF